LGIDQRDTAFLGLGGAPAELLTNWATIGVSSWILLIGLQNHFLFTAGIHNAQISCQCNLVTAM